VEDCYYEDGWDIGLRRALTVSEAEQRNAMLNLLQEVTPDPFSSDEVEWALDKSKNFTTKSLYRFITHRGVCIADARSIWKTKLPLKIKVLIWQLHNNKLQTAVELKKSRWKGDIHCGLCGGIEDTNHIFFGCSLAQFIWCCLRDSFGWDSFPTSWDSLQGGWMSHNLSLPYKLGLFLFAGIAWALWRCRNKMAIEKRFPTSPLDVIWSGVIFVQKWSTLLKEPEQEQIAKALDKVKRYLGSFKENDVLITDVAEL
jgi:hypothetical protein